eukprot:scaffold3111_cov332-Prasinococcus_capsulatus_cf.AAC.7
MLARLALRRRRWFFPEALDEGASPSARWPWPEEVEASRGTASLLPLSRRGLSTFTGDAKHSSSRPGSRICSPLSSAFSAISKERPCATRATAAASAHGSQADELACARPVMPHLGNLGVLLRVELQARGELFLEDLDLLQLLAQGADLLRVGVGLQEGASRQAGIILAALALHAMSLEKKLAPLLILRGHRLPAGQSDGASEWGAEGLRGARLRPLVSEVRLQIFEGFDVHLHDAGRVSRQHIVEVVNDQVLRVLLHDGHVDVARQVDELHRVIAQRRHSRCRASGRGRLPRPVVTAHRRVAIEGPFLVEGILGGADVARADLEGGRVVHLGR